MDHADVVCVGCARTCARRIDPEPILRGLEAEGFFVWSANRTADGDISIRGAFPAQSCRPNG
jgi:hypothetical protein